MQREEKSPEQLCEVKMWQVDILRCARLKSSKARDQDKLAAGIYGLGRPEADLGQASRVDDVGK